MILDPATASIATGVPIRTIQRWTLRGLLTDHGDGWHIRVDVDELAALAESRATRGTGRLPKVTDSGVP